MLLLAQYGRKNGSPPSEEESIALYQGNGDVEPNNRIYRRRRS